MKAANNTIDETIALITAANTVVQNPDAVGTAFKTISMRIRGAKTELEEAGLETEGMVSSTAKLRSEILALSGVDIMENANEFKSTYAILDELALKWKDLSDIQQATITELIAGKRQGNIISSLMTNFDTAREALETSLNSSGSAMAEHAKWQQSLEAQINKLKASWQSLSQSFMSSDFLHITLDIVIGLIDGLTLLIDKAGVLPTFFAGFSIFKSFGNNGLFKTLNNDLDGFINKIGIANNSFADLANAFNSGRTGKGFKGFVSGLSAMKNSLSNTLTKADLSNIRAYNDLLDQGVTAQTAWYRTMQSSSDSAKALVTAANGSKVALNGMKTASIGVKAGLIGAKVAAVAFNAALTIGISLLIDWAISGIMKLVNAKKELAESVEEITSKFKEQSDSLKKLKGDYDTSNESSMISKYEKLSKGVDSLGRNVSLTADEYSEYQSIVNQIAEQIPSLVSGYDSQGNALLSCKGNVEELTEAYENLIKAQNNEIFSNVEDIGKDFNNAVKESNKTNFDKSKMTSSTIGDLKTILNGAYTEEEISEYFDGEYGRSTNRPNNQISTALRDAGVDVDNLNIYKSLASTIKNNPEIIQRIIDDFENDLEEATAGMKTIAQATLSDAFDIKGSEYYGMSDTLQSIAKHIVNGFDFEFYKQYKDNPLGVQTYINDILDQFNSLNTDDNAQIEAVFDLQTRFNNGEVTYGEYAKGIQAAKDVIDGLELDNEVKNTIKLSLDDTEIQTQYNHIRGYLRDFYTNKDTRKMDRDEEYDYKFKARENDKKVEEFLNSLTSDELAAVIDIKAEIDWENTSAEDIRKQIQDRAKLNEALNFSADIEIDKTALEAFNTALEESASAMGLSEESIDSLKAKYSDLEGYNPHTLFEKTANGVKVNREELAKLEKKYNDLTKTEVQEHLDTLVEEYNKCTKAIDGNIGSQEKLELISKREKYAEQIEELAEYQAQLEGVTGAYQRWLDAQNAPEDYEGYEKVATSREDIKDEISRGFLSNSTKEYIDLLSGEDLVGGTIDDYANAWEKLDKKVGSTSYSIHDFFTVNDDGDITSTGIDRFFKGLQQDFKGEVYKFNEDTQEWYYDFSAENLKKIQDEWGIGIEAIELLLEAAASAGYDVDWGGIFDDLEIDTSNFESVEAMISLAEKAQEEFNKLKGVEDVEFNFRTNTIQEATTEVEKARKAFSQFINEDGTVNLKAEGAEQMQFMLSTLITKKQLLSTPAIMKVDTSQIDKAKTDVIDVINKAKELQKAYENYEIAIATGVDVEGAKSDLNSAIEGMKGTSVDVRADLKLPSNEELETAKNSIGDIKIGATLDGTSIGNLTTKIQTECTPEVIAKVTGLDQSAIEGTSQQVVYTAEHSDVDNFINSLTDISKKIIYKYTTEGTKPNPNNIKRTITYEYKTEGDVPEAYGTAHSNGSASGRAFARGNWGIKGSGIALGGELGQELVVRDGKFFTIGDTSAEFFHYKPNDIVFNAAQTESLFKYGGIKGAKPRGTMLASGTAFTEGSTSPSGKAFAWNATSTSSKFAKNRLQQVTADGDKGKSRKSSTKTKTKTKGNSVTTEVKTTFDSNVHTSANVQTSDFANQHAETDIDTKDKKEFEEVFDWIEVAIERIEREIDNLDRTANSSYKSWSERNKALASEISKVSEEIKLQNNAATEYLKKANSVGLDEKWAKKVRNGAIDINTLNQDNSNEELVEKIKNYQKWYELYLDCIDAAEELKETEASLYAQRVENVAAQYEGILGVIEHEKNMLDEYISQSEAQGWLVSAKYYNALASNERENITNLKKQKSAMLAELQTVMESGTIAKGSEAWYDMVASIDEVTVAITEGETALLEYQQTIQQLKWETFDLLQEKISAVTEEADFLIELMSNDKLFDDNGQLTKEGSATIGLHGQNYNTYMYQADLAAKEAARLKAELANDPYDTELESRYREMISLQQEHILAAEGEKEAIRDMVSEGIEFELDALQERIDKYNEALDSQKDLYDYQKRVKEQTKEIASIEKQIASYSGDNSEEAKAKVQELKVSLEDAKADLEETEYDKYISDQQKLLDELYLEYETVLNERLDNVDALISDMIAQINADAALIGDTITENANAVGYTLSNEMNSIWNSSTTSINGVISEYGIKFSDAQTTTNLTLNAINTNLQSMITQLNTIATTKIKSASVSSAANSNQAKPPKTETPKEEPKETPKTIKVGGKINAGNAPIYDYAGAPAERQLYRNDPIYTVLSEKDGYILTRWHKLSSGASGWFKKSDVKALATGAKKIDANDMAWTQEKGQEYIVRPSDGAILTPVAKGDSVLTAQASNNIWQMANSPAEFIKDNLNLGSASVPNNSTVQNSYTQHLDKVVFSFPNVKNYDEMLSAMQKDPNFERLVESMSIGKLAGKSSLAKGKAIR